MCEWSRWEFLCAGRYDIALAVLLGTALLIVGLVMLVSYWKKRGVNSIAADAEFVKLSDRLVHNEISSDEFLDKCNQLHGSKPAADLQGMWKPDH